MEKDTEKFLKELKTLFGKYQVSIGGIDQDISFHLKSETVYVKTGWQENGDLMFRANQWKEIKIK